MSPAASRMLTIVAAAALATDGAALVSIGVWSRRMTFSVVGVVFLASAVLVVLSWRWYRRRLADIASTRRALGDEARDIQRSLRER
jgi:membrane protein implicated in regulation of membrane protease activity